MTLIPVDQRGNDTNPTEATEAILDVFTDSMHYFPSRLIDTTSGQLCDTEKRKNIFKEGPIFQEMVSSMMTQLHRERVDTITRQYLQYVILSHRWEANELELADVLDNLYATWIPLLLPRSSRGSVIWLVMLNFDGLGVIHVVLTRTGTSSSRKPSTTCFIGITTRRLLPSTSPVYHGALKGCIWMT